MSASKMTCSHCGAVFTPFHLPPHDCAGVRADLADAASFSKRALCPATKRPTSPGDTVEWTERVGLDRMNAVRHGRKRGVVTRLVDGGKSVLVRDGNTLVELNMARVTRVASGEVSRKAAKDAKEGVKG